MTARLVRSSTIVMGVAVVVAALVLLLPTGASAETISAAHQGELDCNGDSPAQQSVKLTMFCTDIRGFAGEDNANTWGGRFSTTASTSATTSPT
jgi:hypothetical protein